jgi:hypothetical protein
MIVTDVRTDGNQRGQLDEEQAITVRELDPTAHLALQHGQLMAEGGIRQLSNLSQHVWARSRESWGEPVLAKVQS